MIGQNRVWYVEGGLSLYISTYGPRICGVNPNLLGGIVLLLGRAQTSSLYIIRHMYRMSLVLGISPVTPKE
jgi:hypothetical protein